MDTSHLDKYFNNETKISSSSLKKRLFDCGIKAKKCENCNLDSWLGGHIPLELHHIDGVPLNNALDNLQILCPNCHSLTNNFRASSQRRIIIKKSIEEIIEAIKNSYNPRHALIKLGYHAKGANYQRIYSVKEKYNLEFRHMTEEEIVKEKELRIVGLRISWQAKRDSASQNGKAIGSEKSKMTREESWFKSRKVPRPSKDELLEMVWQKSITSIGKDMGICDNTIRKWAIQYNIPVPPVGYWAKFNNGHFQECQLIKDDLFKSFNLL